MTGTVKTVYVPAVFKGLYEKRTVRRETGKQKGLIFKKAETEVVEDEVYAGPSDAEVSGTALAEGIQEASQTLSAEGYEILSITPVVSGRYAYSDHLDYQYGYGFSYTEGVVILAKSVA